MEIKTDFLNEEERCEYVVSYQQKKVWAVQLDLLQKLQAVCEKYGLKCFAYGGTLLGAVRHHGFIPWDDDIDVALSRDDYNKLCEVADKEFSDPYFFQTALTDKNYFVGHARLRNSNTTGIVSFLCDHIYNNGIYIDICVYDQVPQNDIKFKLLLAKVKLCRFLLTNYYHQSTKSGVKKILLHLFSPLKNRLTYEKLFKMYRNICESYKGSDSARVALLCTPEFIHYEGTYHGITDLVEIDFEYLKLLIPSDFDYMLRKAYGDYMSFPPVDKRGKWHENIIIYDPDISYLDYYRLHPETYKKVLAEIDSGY